MAVVSIKEGYTGVEASGDDRVRRATRVFTVVTNDGSDRGLWDYPLSVGGVTIPAPGTAHPDKSVYVSRIPSVTKKGPTYFEVRVPYQTPDGQEPDSNYEDPLSMPADISWDDAERTVAYDKDVDNTPVVNVLDEPFDPPPTREISDPVLIIERNQAAFDPDDKLTYQDTISSTSFWGAAAGRPRMGKIKARSVYAETPYWRVRYEVIFRMKTPADVPAAKAWWRQILNQGVKYKDSAGKIQLSPNGELVLLDSDGKKTTAATPHWLSFREFPDQSWVALGLE